MKPMPAPEIPGNTPWERLDHAFRRALRVPKEVLDKELAGAKRTRTRRRARVKKR
ncbi:MAG: hypothetical protein AB1806_16640 [Acidobacteriota bacterium]